MSLFTKVHDRQRTQLAYKVNYYPWQVLPAAAKELIVWRRGLILTKSMIVAGLSDDLTTFTFKQRPYKVVWAYNNTPTEDEWNKKSDNFHMHVDLRCSPAIPEFAVAVLDFQLADTAVANLIATKQASQ
jgi:hypothetical protein